MWLPPLEGRAAEPGGGAGLGPWGDACAAGKEATVARKSRRDGEDGVGRATPGDRRRARRWLRRIALFTVVATIVVVLAALLLERPLLERVVRPLLTRELAAWSGLEVELGEIDFEWSGVARVTGIRLGGGAPVSALEGLEVSSVEVRLRPVAGLLGSAPLVESVRVTEPRIALDLARSPLIPPLAAEEEPDEETGEPTPLPEVTVSGGAIRLRDGERHLELSGVDVGIAGDRIELAVARGGGWWETPVLGLVRFPLRGAASLRGPSDAPFARLAVEHVADADGPLLERVEVDLSDPDDVLVRGEAPRWRARVDELRLGQQGLSLTASVRGARIGPLAETLVEDAPSMDGRLTAEVSVGVPREDPAAWTAEGHAALEGFALRPAEGEDAEVIEVGEAFASFSRADAGHVVSDVHVERLSVGPPAASADLRARLVLSTGAEEGELVLEVLETVVSTAGAHASVEGELRLPADGAPPYLERASVRVDEAALGPILAAWLPPREDGPVSEPSSGVDGCVSLEARLGGGVDPETWHGGLRVGASLELEGTAGAFEVSGRLGIDTGTLRIGELLVRRGADWARMSGLLRGPDPWRVDGVRIDGEWAGEAVALEELSLETEMPTGAIEVAGLRAFLLGSEVELFARSDLARGRHEARLDMAGLTVTTGVLRRLGVVLPAEVARSGASAKVSAALALSTWPDATGTPDPEVDVWVRIEDGRADFGSLAVRDLRAELHARADREELEVVRLDVSRRGAHLEGSGRVAARWEPFPRPDASSVAVFSLRGEIDDVGDYLAVSSEGAFRELRGRATSDLRVRVPFDGDGFPGLPVVGGSLAFREGLVRLHGTSPAIRSLRGRFDIREYGIEISSLTGTLSRSPFTVVGRVDARFPWQEGGAGVASVDVRIGAERALLLAQPDLRVRGDIDLRWKGPWERTIFTGTIDVERAYYLQNISITSGGAKLPFDLFHIQEEPLRSAKLDVDIRSAKGITLINNVINSRASAALKLRGTGLDPFLTGTVFTDEGVVRIGNSTLPLRSALVEFRESAPFNPEIDAILSRRIRDYQLTVTADGTLENPEILMQSSPPLSQQELFLLVTTGKTSEDIDRVGSGSFAAAQAAQYVGSSIVNYFMRGSDPTERSFWERFRLETETAKKRTLDDLIRVEYQIYDFENFLDQNEIFVQSERDFYGDYNMNLGWRLEIP